MREFEDALNAASTRTNSRNYVRGILKERTGNEIKKRRSEKEEKGKKKTHKVTFNFCELFRVTPAFRLHRGSL